jgi:hypothetical protein
LIHKSLKRIHFQSESKLTPLSSLFDFWLFKSEENQESPSLINYVRKLYLVGFNTKVS